MQTDSRKRLFTFFIMIFAGTGGILYGYDLGIIAGALLFIKKHIHITDTQVSFIVAAVLGGGSFATLVSGKLADWFGRKNMIIFASLIFLAGIFLVTFAKNYNEILFGRLTQGIGVGIVTIIIPLYLAELMPAHIRGRAITTFQLLLTAGILLATLVGLYFTPTGNWRAMFISAGIPGIILLFGCFLLPKSPRWLFLKGKIKQAKKVLEKTRPTQEADKELEIMQNILARTQKHRSALEGSLWQKHFILPLFIVLTIACLQQLTGINSILQFSPLILKSAGLSSNVIDMFGSNCITGLNFVITIIALLLIDKVGRKILLCLGTAGITIGLAFSGCIYFFMVTSILKGWLLLIGLLVFIMTYAIGPGVVIWLILSELLPARVRSNGMALGLFLNSLVSTLLASVYMPLMHRIGYAGIFWLCAFFTLIYFFMAYFMVPETKDKTLEQIEQHFIKHKE